MTLSRVDRLMVLARARGRMTNKTFLLMMKIFHQAIDADHGLIRLRVQTNRYMKKTPFRSFSEEEDVDRVYDPTIPFVEPRRRA